MLRLIVLGLLYNSAERFGAEAAAASADEEPRPPAFLYEPPSSVLAESQSGALIRCSATGNPAPTIRWTLDDGVTDAAGVAGDGAVYVLPNSSLRIAPFRATFNGRREYRCAASNAVGRVVSRRTTVKSVFTGGQYISDVTVQNVWAMKGNTAVFKCEVNPSYLKEFVRVEKWMSGGSVIQNDDRFVTTGAHDRLQLLGVREEDNGRNVSCSMIHTLDNTVTSANQSAVLKVLEPVPSIPVIVYNEERVTVKAGTTAELPCVAHSHPAPWYAWTKDDRPLPLQSVRLRQTGGNLYIMGATMDDSGVYSCLAGNNMGSSSALTRLVVTEAISVAVTPAEQTVDAGQTAELSCTTSGGPAKLLRWLKDGRPLMPSSSAEIVAAQYPAGSLLRLRNVTRRDAGMYQCLADGDYDNAQGSARVMLGASAPVLLEPLSERRVIADASVLLRCSAYGTPLPTIAWSLDGHPVDTSNARVKVTSFQTAEGDVVSYVNVSSTQPMDAGLYECLARNSAGRAASSAKLLILGLYFIKPLSNVTAVSRQDVNVTCRAAGYPYTQVEWQKDGQGLRPSHRLSFVASGDMLRIRDVEKADEGCYRCSIPGAPSSSVGAARVACIKVIEPPAVKLQPPFGQPPKLGDSIVLTCHIGGDQPIAIEWLRNNVTIVPSTSVEPKRVTDSMSILALRGLSRDAGGEYTCRASNAAAASSDSVQLHVNVPPAWVVAPTDAQVMLGGGVTLRCQCSGFPEPRIVWSRHRGSAESSRDAGDGRFEQVDTGRAGGRIQLFANGTLHIQRVEEGDGGDYLCHASNNITSGISKSITLTVHVPAYFVEVVANYTVHKGRSIAIECNPRGDTPMSVVWSTAKANATRVKVTDDGRKSVLQLSPALREDTDYYSCKAMNKYGQATFIAQLIVIEEPDPPANVRIERASSRAVRLAWTEPFDGNVPIEQYIVQFSNVQDPWPADENGGWDAAAASISLSAASETSYTVNGLRPARAYKFRIVCSNAIGRSLPSQQAVSTTLEEAPSGAPRNMRLMANSSTEIVVTWLAPEADELNSLAAGFTVRYAKADSPSMATTSQQGSAGGVQQLEVELPMATVTPGASATFRASLSGLQRFTRYKVAVRAFNALGVGPWSVEAFMMTLEDVPSQPPGDVYATAGPGRRTISVMWSTPLLPTLHGILQGYKVFVKPMRTDEDETATRVVAVSSMSLRLEALEHFTNYSVEVLAYTRMGEGARSRPLYVRTLPAEPSAPSDIRAMAHNGSSILVVWQPPLQPNGILEKYTLYVTSGKKSLENITFGLPNLPTSCVVSGLNESTTYRFRIAAKTQHAEYGDATSSVQATPLTEAPARVASWTAVTYVARHDDVTLPCVAVGNPSPAVRWTRSDGVQLPADRSSVLSNGSLAINALLLNDTGNYTCQASNAYGRDSITMWLRVRANQDDGSAPGAPSAYVAATTADTVQINWRAGRNGGSPIKGFQLEFKKEHDVWQPVNQGSANRSFTFEHLSCGTPYLFRIRSDNRIGSGPYSELVKGSTNGSVPIAPPQSLLVKSVNSSIVELDLTTWQDGGCRIEYFAAWFHVWGDSNWHLISSKLASGEKLMKIEGLHPGTWYTIKVAAYNSAGSTETELLLATLTYEGNEMPKQRVLSVVEPELHERLVVVVPLAVAIVLVICLALGVALYYRRRQEKKRIQEARARNLRHDITKETSLAGGAHKADKHRSTMSRSSPCCGGRSSGTGSLLHSPHRVLTHPQPASAMALSAPRQSVSHESRIWLLHRHASGLTESENGGCIGLAGATTDEEMNPYATFSCRNGGEYEDCETAPAVRMPAKPAGDKANSTMRTFRSNEFDHNTEEEEVDEDSDTEEDEIAKEKRRLKEYDVLMQSHGFPLPPPELLLAPIAEGRTAGSSEAATPVALEGGGAVLSKARRFASEEKVPTVSASAETVKGPAAVGAGGGARPNTTGPYPGPKGTAAALEKILHGGGIGGAAGNSQNFLSSLTTVSSNHEELFSAFQNSRMNPPPPYGLYETPTTLTSSSARPTPESSDVTEPGIRQFTQSPPLPEETRQAVCEVPIYDKDVLGRSSRGQGPSSLGGYGRHQQQHQQQQRGVNPSEMSSDTTTDHELPAARLPRHKSPHRKPHHRRRQKTASSTTPASVASSAGGSGTAGYRRAAIARTPARPNRVRSHLSNDAGVGTSILCASDIVESFDGGRQSYFRATSPSEGYASRTANSYIYTDTSDYATNHYRRQHGLSSRGGPCTDEHGAIACDERRPLVCSAVQTGESSMAAGVDEELKLLDRYYRTIKDDDKEKKVSKEYTANYTIV